MRVDEPIRTSIRLMRNRQRTLPYKTHVAFLGLISESLLEMTLIEWSFEEEFAS